MEDYQAIIKMFDVKGFHQAFEAQQRLYSHSGKTFFGIFLSFIAGALTFSSWLYLSHQANIQEALLLSIFMVGGASFVGAIAGMMFLTPLKSLARKIVPAWRRDVKKLEQNSYLVIQHFLSHLEWQQKIAKGCEETLEMNFGCEYNIQVKHDIQAFKLACGAENHNEAMQRLMNIYAFISSMQQTVEKRDSIKRFDESNTTRDVEQEMSIGQNI